MLKNRFFGISLLLVLGMVLLSSCAKPPEQEMQAARDAIANATNAEANLYAADLLTLAQDSLTQAETFFGEKKFADAKRLALFTKSWADSAAAMAVTNKEQMKTTAETAVNDASAKLETLKKGKIPPKMKAEVKTCDTNLAEAKTALGAGDYKKASDLATDVTTKITAIEEGMKKPAGGTKKK